MKKLAKSFFASLVLMFVVAFSWAADVEVIFTNDVHCGFEENLGYAALAAFKKERAAEAPVILADCGDSIQGDVIGAVSKGELPVKMMNELGYDYAVFGNHEFDYGMQQLSKLLSDAKAQYLACNIVCKGKSALAKAKPYDIKEIGGMKIGFVGVSTPKTLVTSTPTYFMNKKGKFIYSFSHETPELFYSTVQKSIDACKSGGAKFVVVLAHLGDEAECAPFRSIDLAQNTSGIDIILDGHAHSVIERQEEKGADGKAVVITSTGTKLANFGVATLHESGEISCRLVSKYDKNDEEYVKFLEEIKADLDKKNKEIVAKSNIALSDKTASGARAVRNQETAIGNLCADAYRSLTGADVAIVNGGGIRSALSQGDITYEQVVKIHPFGNMLCLVEATGSQILDALEHSCRALQEKSEENGNAVGEVGGFLQVSGVKFTVDTSIKSTVELDENGLFKGVSGERRVKDVQVLQKDGSFAPIDSGAKYKLASHNYLLKNSGDGYTMFAKDKLLLNETLSDYQVLINYISQVLKGNLKAYAKTEGRINIK